MQIASHLLAIKEKILHNPVTMVIAPTGTGKSIGIPAILAADGWRCFVSVPTVVAAISLSRDQEDLQNDAWSKNKVPLPAEGGRQTFVGYIAEGTDRNAKTALIVYATSGHMRRRLLKLSENGEMADIDFCDVLVVDEAHTGTIDNTVIISLWMLAASQGRRIPFLVLTTATPIPLRIDGDVMRHEVEVHRTHPINVNFHDKSFPLSQTKQLYEELAAKVAEKHASSAIDTGHMLVFVPGEMEAQKVAQAIAKRLQNINEDTLRSAEILTAFSGMKDEDRLRLKRPLAKKRKIIVTTNLLETSITIDNLGFVFDSLLEKLQERSDSGGVRLNLRYISKDSAKQRAGRTGRTREGHVFYMCTQNFFNELTQSRPSEVERIPLENVALEILDRGLGIEDVLGVSDKYAAEARDLLEGLGLVERHRHGFLVTEMGHFIPTVPLSVRNGLFLWKWLTSVDPPLHPYPGIVIAALLDCYGPPYYFMPPPDDSNYEAQRQKHLAGLEEGADDLILALHLFIPFNTLLLKLHKNRKSLHSSIKIWSQKRNLNNRKLKELADTIIQIIDTLPAKVPIIPLDGVTPSDLKKLALPFLTEAYAGLVFRLSRKIYLSPKNEIFYQSSILEIKAPHIIAAVSLSKRVNFAISLDRPAPKPKAKISHVWRSKANLELPNVDTEPPPRVDESLKPQIERAMLTLKGLGLDSQPQATAL